MNISIEDLLREIDRLRDRLQESEETIRAIRQGEVDAIMVSDTSGEQVFTLRTADRTYRAIIEEMNEAAATLTVEGTILFGNTAFAQLLRLAPETVAGFTIHDAVPPDEMELFEAMLRKAGRDGVRGEISFVTTGGKPVPVFLSMKRLEDIDPPILSLLATDLSDQKRNERIVAEGKLASTILEQVSEAVLVCDNQGRITHASRTANALCREYPVNKHFDAIFSLSVLDDLPQAQATRIDFSFIRKQNISRIETRFHRKNGPDLDLLISAAPLSDEQGERMGLVVTMVDITERRAILQDLRETKDQLLKTNQELESRVRLRTAELETANKAKDEFLANMSHEIRTPMTGVFGIIESLLQRDLPEDVQEDLHMVLEAADSVLTLLGDLFDLSRIELGQLDLHPTAFEIRPMIRSIVGPFHSQARAKGLDFNLSIEDLPDQVIGDRYRMAQVLKNLISNAIKFTDQGSIHVEVRAEGEREDTVRLRFTVSDTGIGIPPEQQQDIFHPFTQLDSSYSKKFSGMGLGLTISRSLVERMGGKIEMESEPGKGARFTFSLDCGKVPEEEPGPGKPSFSLADLPSLTVLLAEDNKVNRIFLRRALETAGHKLIEAENGREALEKVADNRVDLILMDIQMPEMDGIEATKTIHADALAPGVPIIALTAYALKGDREKFLDAGMDGYVSKPVDFNVLAEVIRSLLEKERA
ncbi:MAG: ATP-binding protein [bacterium]